MRLKRTTKTPNKRGHTIALYAVSTGYFLCSGHMYITLQ